MFLTKDIENAVFPIAGRPPITINSPFFHPNVILSNSVKPDCIPLSLTYSYLNILNFFMFFSLFNLSVGKVTKTYTSFYDVTLEKKETATT